MNRRRLVHAMAGAAVAACASGALADFPPFEKVSEGYEKVTSTVDGSELYTLWVRKKDGQMLAELPRGYERQKHFFAMTVSSGETFAGLQGADFYTYWKRYDDRLALIQPNLEVRSSGDPESRASVEQIWTDRVLLDVPILCMGPGGQPVIDMDSLILGNGTTFYGGSARGLNARLLEVSKAKSFEKNVEIAFKAPTSGGQFKTFDCSITNVVGTPGYKPRAADSRVGYFATTYRDLGKFDYKSKNVRYINRWNLEKRDPSLKLSPPKQPIVFYVEHTVPVRYRRWVRQGIEYWNKAFEEVGFLDAIEVRYQDASTGEHMDKDPEDARYNFIRWLSNDIGTAIGPSRAHPETGEILDADVVLTDGWIRAFWYQYNEYMPQLATEGFGPDLLAWLEKNPSWDPRLRMASPAQRQYLEAQRAARGVQPYGGHPIAMADPTMMGDDEYDGLVGRVSQMNGLCMAANGRAMDMMLMRMHLEMLDMLGPDGDADCEDCEDGEACDACEMAAAAHPEGDTLDGVPDWFAGPALADLVCHEVGHTLGLRHNFKASSLYTLEEINSAEVKGKPQTASVMDYNPVNINMGDGEIQGDYFMVDIGPYDMWAIKYGYTGSEKDLPEILSQCSLPEHTYGTDEDTFGPDPYARRYDFAKDPINFAKSRQRLADYHRERILDKFVKDGESWAQARRGYEITLGIQASSISIMSNWIGGSFVNRDKKGDPGGREPVVPVAAEDQREALQWVIDHSFYDDAYGLTPDLLAHMTVEKWYDDMNSIMNDATWPVHDRILGIQASALTQLMNPITLQHVWDIEYRTPTEEDALTLPELFDTLREAAWTEVNGTVDQHFTNRDPMISSLRRNLQREHLERLIDLTKPGDGFTAAEKPISNLALMNLRILQGRIDKTLDQGNSRIDAYTAAHLTEASKRIAQVLDAQYIYNTNDIGGGSSLPSGFFFKSQQQD